jgi:DNA-binding transcriptional LysR family regulator
MRPEIAGTSLSRINCHVKFKFVALRIKLFDTCGSFAMLAYLHTFATAAALGSFSGAAVRLGLTQSAVSMQIKRLEADLDCRLFERLGKAVVLSAGGRALLPQAEEILRIYAAMKARTDASQARGKIDLGAISTVQLGLLPAALAAFRQVLPRVEVNVVPGTSVQLMSQIDSNELDIAVMIKPNLRMNRGLAWTTLMKETYVAVAGASSTETSLRELLANHPFIRYSRRSYGGQLVDDYLRRQRYGVDHIMELDEPAVILEMVRQGLGVAIIPYDLAAGDGWADDGASAIRLLALDGGVLVREIGILQRLVPTPDPVVAGLIDSLTRAAREKQQRSKRGLEKALAGTQGNARAGARLRALETAGGRKKIPSATRRAKSVR